MLATIGFILTVFAIGMMCISDIRNVLGPIGLLIVLAVGSLGSGFMFHAGAEATRILNERPAVVVSPVSSLDIRERGL